MNEEHLIKVFADLASGKAQRDFSEKLKTSGQTLYSSDKNDPTVVVKLLPNGEHIRSRFVNRKFVALGLPYDRNEAPNLSSLRKT